MNQQPNIDDLLRRRVQNAELQPPGFVWPNIERELRKKRRRLFLWLWFAGAGLAATALWAFWAFQPKPQTARIAAEPLLKEKISSPSGIVPLKTAPAVAAPTQNRLAAGQNNTPAAAAAPATHKNELPATPKTVKIQAKSTAALPVAPAPTTSAPRADQAPLPLEKTDPSALPPAAVAAATTPDAPQLRPAAPELPLAAPNAERPLASLSLARNVVFPTIKYNAIRKRKDPRTKHCYDFDRHSSAWLVDVYAGPAFARKTFFARPDDQPYLKNRLATERRDWAFAAGVRGSWLFEKQFLLRSGLHYEQMTEVFEYIDPNYIKVKVEYISVIKNGQWVTIADTTGIDYGSNYTKTFNRFGILDIPLLAGVELRNGRTGLSINTGVTMNVLFWKQGSILSQNNAPVSFTPKDKRWDVYRTRLGLSVMGSVQWFWHVQPRFRVFVEPYYHHIVRPVTLSSHPVELRYGIGGVNFGFTHILNKQTD